MKLFNFLLLFLFINNAFGQDLINLDRKMGFNKFRLETSFNNYKTNLKFLATDKQKVKHYEYIGKDITSIFGITHKSIILSFYNNSLYSISINFNYTTEQEDAILQKKLKELFGYTKTSYDAESESGTESEYALMWKSSKVLLQLGKYKVIPGITIPWVTEIFFLSKKIKAEISDSEF